jgi:hypothetical protein
MAAAATGSMLFEATSPKTIQKPHAIIVPRPKTTAEFTRCHPPVSGCRRPSLSIRIS